MAAFIYQRLTDGSVASAAVISISIMLLSGFLMTRITKRLRLPNVTAYILAGILVGPFGLNLVPDLIVEGTGFLPDIALAFIAFGTGEFFKLSTLRRNGAKVVVITLFESLTASAAVFVVTYCILRLDLAFAAVLSALASATAPASTLMTIRQTRANGDFVDTLLQVVALDDVVGLVAYSAAIYVAALLQTGTSAGPLSLAVPILQNLGVLVLGGCFGLVLKLMLQKRSTDNRLIITVALLFAFCGVCTVFSVSPLLGCMAMGTVYANVSGDDKLFKQLNYFSPPLLLLFFVRSGVSFDLAALLSPSGAVGAWPLLAVGVFYFLVRIFGKYVGAYVGCKLVRKPNRTSACLGLALVPQAGVAIGLAAMGARTLGGETGAALQTIVLASSVLYELIGPASAKLALYLSHSYATSLEESVAVEEVTEQGRPKNQVELLIERIQKIQTELPQHLINENEAAFTDAAEEQRAEEQRYAMFNLPRQRQFTRR